MSILWQVFPIYGKINHDIIEEVYFIALGNRSRIIFFHTRISEAKKSDVIFCFLVNGPELMKK